VVQLRHLGWNINPVVERSDSAAPLTARIELLRRAGRELAYAGADFILLSEPAPAYADLAGSAFSASLDPLTLAPLLFDADGGIDVVTAINPALYDPYLAARQIAGLFHASRGRAALYLQEDIDARTVAGATRLQRVPLNHEEVRARTSEWLGAVRSLWSSWDDDAVVEDFENHIYADHRRIHRIDVDGEYFRLIGPAETLPFPDGAPLVFASAYRAGVLNRPAIEGADVLSVASPTLAGLAAAEAAIRDALAAAGRIHVPVLAVLTVLPVDAAPDGLLPFADAGAPGESPGTASGVRGRWADAVVPVDALVERVADLAAAAPFDGLLLNQSIDRRTLNRVVDEVVPDLRAAGLLAGPRTGTLRDRLALGKV